MPIARKLAGVWMLLELCKTVTCAERQEELKFDAAQARAILKHLVEEGMAVTDGKARGTRYLPRKSRGKD